MAEEQFDAPRATQRISTAPQPTVLRAVVIEGRDVGKTALLGSEPLLIGSDPGATLCLSDPTVSRHHLSLERVGDAVLVRDLGSSNGTYLGGRRLTESVVSPGTVLCLGRSTLALLVDGARVAFAQGPPALGEMVGTAPVMRRLFQLIERVALSGVIVLITGETGTGKELVARTLHERSRRQSGPFEVFDCAAVPETLIAGELFGHVRGAFTGAHRDHPGAFERAHGGTLFIDEIGELTPDLQPKLLRVLESRRVRRIGDLKDRCVDVRIVAATHRDLWQMAAEHRFRQDLLYRLVVVNLHVPPLRERREDLTALVAHFAARLDPPPPPLVDEVIERLMAWHWPGNLRELRNLVERAAALGSWSDEIFTHMQPVATHGALTAGGGPDAATPARVAALTPSNAAAVGGFREAKEQALTAFEREYLRDLLQAHQWNLSRAARAAAMDRSHLSSLVRKYGLRPRGAD